MKYETGRWYPWDGSRSCPFDRDIVRHYTTVLDTSVGHYWDNKVNVYTQGGSLGGLWEYDPLGPCRKVVAFYIVSYNEPKEMTVAEIEKELGYSVKVVK